MNETTTSLVVKEASKHPSGSDGSVGKAENKEFAAAGQPVSEYTVPKVSHYDEIKPSTETPTNLPDEVGCSQGLPNDQNHNTSHESCNGAERVSEIPEESPARTSEKTSTNETSNESSSHNNTETDMNGGTVVAAAGQDNVDGVKELASVSQQTVAQNTEKSRRRVPPPIKPKAFKKTPPPTVAPKPKPAGHKIGKIEHDSTG